jgi:glycosyltransferase involved in cell wall biosynthesis
MAGSTVTNVIFVTQVLDHADPALGFVVRQLSGLSRRVDRLVVIANEVRTVPGDLDAEVVSLGKERGDGRLVRAARYQRAVVASGRRLRPATLVAHMCPVYVVAAAPVARALGLPQVLWFAHPTGSRRLRAAERLADAVITTFPDSYPRPGPKVHPIGQAIDVDAFSSVEAPSVAPVRLLAVGRTSPMKNFDTVIRAIPPVLARGARVSLRIVGPSTNAAERNHRAELRRLVADLALEEVVTIEDGVAPAAIPDLMGWSTAVVNAMPYGSADKVVLEAMAAARPVLVSNPVFAPLLEATELPLQFRAGDTASLSAAVMALCGARRDQLERVGATLRDRVAQQHSLAHWTDAVVGLCTRLHDGAERPCRGGG